MARSSFAYVTYIRATPHMLWTALTDRRSMEQYWFGMHAESDWTTGSSWRLVARDGQVWDAGEIVEAQPPRRLVIRWQHQNRPELQAEGPSLCTMELQPLEGAVKLSVTHAVEHAPSPLIEAVSGGWPMILSNLKSLLETGAVAFTQPLPEAGREQAPRE